MGDVRVGFNELFDVLLVLRGALLEVADGQRQVRELGQRGQQRRGGGRVAGVGHVVRDSAEQREPANASLPESNLHEGRQGRGELHVVRDLRAARGQQGGVSGLDVHGSGPRVGDAGGHAVQREGDLHAGALADVVDGVREGLPVRVRFGAVQDKDRISHVVFDQVEHGLGHDHVRRGHPVVNGHDGPVRAVVHEGVGIEGSDALVVQRPQHLPDRYAPGGAGVNRPIEVDEENLGLRACGGPVLVKVGRGDAHVSSSCSVFSLMSNVPVGAAPRHARTRFELGAKSRC